MASSHNHLKMDTIPAEFVYSLVVKGWSYRDISEHLQSMYPHIQRGLSERSVRFCCEHGITKLKGARTSSGAWAGSVTKGFISETKAATGLQQRPTERPMPLQHAAANSRLQQ